MSTSTDGEAIASVVSELDVFILDTVEKAVTKLVTEFEQTFNRTLSQAALGYLGISEKWGEIKIAEGSMLHSCVRDTTQAVVKEWFDDIVREELESIKANESVKTAVRRAFVADFKQQLEWKAKEKAKDMAQAAVDKWAKEVNADMVISKQLGATITDMNNPAFLDTLKGRIDGVVTSHKLMKEKKERELAEARAAHEAEEAARKDRRKKRPKNTKAGVVQAVKGFVNAVPRG